MIWKTLKICSSTNVLGTLIFLVNMYITNPSIETFNLAGAATIFLMVSYISIIVSIPTLPVIFICLFGSKKTNVFASKILWLILSWVISILIVYKFVSIGWPVRHVALNGFFDSNLIPYYISSILCAVYFSKYFLKKEKKSFTGTIEIQESDSQS